MERHTNWLRKNGNLEYWLCIIIPSLEKYKQLQVLHQDQISMKGTKWSLPLDRSCIWTEWALSRKQKVEAKRGSNWPWRTCSPSSLRRRGRGLRTSWWRDRRWARRRTGDTATPGNSTPSRCTWAGTTPAHVTRPVKSGQINYKGNLKKPDLEVQWKWSRWDLDHSYCYCCGLNPI